MGNRDGIMSTTFRFGQPLGRTAAVGALPKQSLVSLPVRSEHNPLGIGSPQWRTIIAFKCQTSHRGGAGQIVNPEYEFTAVIERFDNQLFSIRRNARGVVSTCRQW